MFNVKMECHFVFSISLRGFSLSTVSKLLKLIQQILLNVIAILGIN